MERAEQRLAMYKPWLGRPWSEVRRSQFRDELRHRRAAIIKEARKQRKSVREVLRQELSDGGFDCVDVAGKDAALSLEELLDLEQSLIEEIEEEDREVLLLQYADTTAKDKEFIERLITASDEQEGLGLGLSKLSMGSAASEGATVLDDSWLPFLEEDCNMEQEEVKQPSAASAPSAPSAPSTAQPSPQAITRTAVLCPLCFKHQLCELEGVCACICGFRLHAKDDGLTVDYLQQRLASVFNAHSASCDRRPECAPTRQWGNQHIVCSCKRCGFVELVV